MINWLKNLFTMFFGEKLTLYDCGHTGKNQTHVKVYFANYEEPAELLLDLKGETVRCAKCEIKLAVRCAICGATLLHNSPITLQLLPSEHIQALTFQPVMHINGRFVCCAAKPCNDKDTYDGKIINGIPKDFFTVHLLTSHFNLPPVPYLSFHFTALTL